MKSGVTIQKDRLKQVLASIRALPKTDVLVGVPAEKTAHTGGITNAAIGYIAEKGAPEANIPARPWLMPGIRNVQDRITNYMAQAAKAGLVGNQGLMLRAMGAAGMIAASSAQGTIQRGIAPPLADSTLRRRARRGPGKGVRINKGAIAELEARGKGGTLGFGAGGATPLIDTSQFIHSITYVVRRTGGFARA